ncbi:hypothetical protein RFI_15932, partial [Reticulomyxa filosa]
MLSFFSKLKFHQQTFTRFLYLYNWNVVIRYGWLIAKISSIFEFSQNFVQIKKKSNALTVIFNNKLTIFNLLFQTKNIFHHQKLFLSVLVLEALFTAISHKSLFQKKKKKNSGSAIIRTYILMEFNRSSLYLTTKEIMIINACCFVLEKILAQPFENLKVETSLFPKANKNVLEIKSGSGELFNLNDINEYYKYWKGLPYFCMEYFPTTLIFRLLEYPCERVLQDQ